MSVPDLRHSVLRSPDAPVAALVLMPGLGTSLESTWSRVTPFIREDLLVVGIDLPGHGGCPAWHGSDGVASIRNLADGAVVAMDRALTALGMENLGVHFAGISLGGGVALELGLLHSHSIASLMVVCSAPKIGDPAIWVKRASEVRQGGTDALVQGSIARWYAPEFVEQEPQVVATATRSLKETDDLTYIALCEALERFDVWEELSEISVPSLLVAGECDTVTPKEDMKLMASKMPHSQFHIVTGVAHQAPTESPRDVGKTICQFIEQRIDPR